MTGAPKREGVVLRMAKAFARRATPPSMWPVVQDDIQDELSRRDWPSWRLELWQVWVFCTIGLRVGGERLRAGVGLGLSDLAGDLRYAGRALRRRPLTSASVVATIAVAVGATTSAYTVVNGVLLSPLLYPDSDRLARIWQTTATWGEVSEAEFRSQDNRLSPLAPSFEDWSKLDVGFQSMGAYVDAAFVLDGGEGTVAVRGQGSDVRSL